MNITLTTILSIKAYLKFCKITKTPSWEPYNPSNGLVTSFELDIYNDGDMFDNTNDYINDPFYEENDSDDQESPSKADKDVDYVDESGTDFGTFECLSFRNLSKWG